MSAQKKETIKLMLLNPKNKNKKKKQPKGPSNSKKIRTKFRKINKKIIKKAFSDIQFFLFRGEETKDVRRISATKLFHSCYWYVSDNVVIIIVFSQNKHPKTNIQ